MYMECEKMDASLFKMGETDLCRGRDARALVRGTWCSGAAGLHWTWPRLADGHIITLDYRNPLSGLKYRSM